MQPSPNSIEPLRSALFVDFDNIHISLAQMDNHLAVQFASNPDRWLEWLENRLPATDGSERQRRILIRRCYLNPQTFANYRPYFIRSAFEVVDCPPLTTRGKTSTDIHMVMDILDALEHPVYIHEFILLSGDADFTPVLLRLRKHDRRSATLSVGYASPAYKAACNYLISQEAFLRDALGISFPEEDSAVIPYTREISPATAPYLQKMADRLAEAAAIPGGIQASDLPEIYKEFTEFRQGSHWLGFYSMRRLTETLIGLRNDLVILEEDPWRVARLRLGVEARGRHARPLPGQEVRNAISLLVRGIVAESLSPTPMATLAQAINQRFGEQLMATDWMGAGSFKNFLTSLDLGDLQISLVNPGYVYDPARHTAPTVTQPAVEIEPSLGPPSIPQLPTDEFALRYPDLAPLARKIHQLTETPYLLPEHYALLLKELAREINERGYQLTRTSKTVRDRCVEKGAPLARSHINFVLIGLNYSGYRFNQDGPETAARLAEPLAANILNLCKTAQMTLNENEVAQVRAWIGSKIEK